jgi:cysteine desulfurase
MVYLDANATEPLRPEARDAAAAAQDLTGNPSSIHAAGRKARSVVESARETIAALFGGEPASLVFTSGGTEADVSAIFAFGSRQERRIITSAVEHDAVRTATASQVTIPVDRDGRADLNWLETVLGDNKPSLVCLMLANNETGVVQPVAEAAALCRRFGHILHVDAVQAAGRMPVNLAQLGAHSIAISSHKLGGPAGVGALLLAPDAPFDAPLIAGGGQERGRRGGTQPVAAIAGFAVAAAAGAMQDAHRLAALRDSVEAAAVGAGAVVCGDRVQRLPNTTCLALPGAAAMTQVMALDLAGIAVSAGSACSSGKVQTSHVLEAMGLGALAGQAVRVSLPWNVSQADIDTFISAYAGMATRLAPSPAFSA